MAKIAVTISGRTYEIDLSPLALDGKEICVQVDGQALPILVLESAPKDADLNWVFVDGRPYELNLDPELSWIKTGHLLHFLAIQDLAVRPTLPVVGDGRVKAPIPGIITRLCITVGQQVVTGQPLLVLEAMKMENEIRAPCAGEVQILNVSTGQRVVLDQVLMEIA